MYGIHFYHLEVSKYDNNPKMLQKIICLRSKDLFLEVTCIRARCISYVDLVTIILLRIRKECHVKLTVANALYIPVIPHRLSGVLLHTSKDREN